MLSRVNVSFLGLRFSMVASYVAMHRRRLDCDEDATSKLNATMDYRGFVAILLRGPQERHPDRKNLCGRWRRARRSVLSRS
jgi:hypothetical protein